MEFGNILKKLRLEHGLSQQELSERLNVGRSTLANYEQNKRNPDFETLELITDYFNVDTDYMLGKTDIRNKYQYLKALGWSEDDILATPYDLESIAQVNENINDEILKLEPFDNLIDAIYFIKKYDVKLSKGIDFNKMTGDSILALINTILTATQETIKKERQKK